MLTSVNKQVLPCLAWGRTTVLDPQSHFVDRILPRGRPGYAPRHRQLLAPSRALVLLLGTRRIGKGLAAAGQIECGRESPAHEHSNRWKKILTAGIPAVVVGHRLDEVAGMANVVAIPKPSAAWPRSAPHWLQLQAFRLLQLRRHVLVGWRCDSFTRTVRAAGFDAQARLCPHGNQGSLAAGAPTR